MRKALVALAALFVGLAASSGAIEGRAPAGLVRTVIHNRDFDLRQVGPDRLLAAADSPGRTLAATLHISRANAYARVERLRTTGVIRGFRAEVDLERFEA